MKLQLCKFRLTVCGNRHDCSSQPDFQTLPTFRIPHPSPCSLGSAAFLGQRPPRQCPPGRRSTHSGGDAGYEGPASRPQSLRPGCTLPYHSLSLSFPESGTSRRSTSRRAASSTAGEGAIPKARFHSSSPPWAASSSSFEKRFPIPPRCS